MVTLLLLVIVSHGYALLPESESWMSLTAYDSESWMSLTACDSVSWLRFIV